MDYRDQYKEWLTKDCFDEETKAELRAIENNEEEIRDRFYTELEFGTAGLRGIIGAGLNRMNLYTVGRATQGLADYIVRQGLSDRGVAIAYDSRHMSPEFADASARVLAANGVKAYIFESLRPTPELSFAVRYLHCTAGINITASHNPPEYNGYKVYWADGAQITPPHDAGITECVAAIRDFSLIRSMSREEAVSEGLYQVIGADVDDPYIEEVKKQVKHPEAISAEGKNLKIVYTPFHGTGLVPVTRVLRELGFENVYVVPEQAAPDGDFPTVDYPNPEDKKAFAMALRLAEEKDADLVLATDPDADRLGVYVKDREGNYQVLTGNMSGCLLAEYTLAETKALRGLPEDGALIKSIVSSNMANAIARYYGVSLIETLTGFKYIGGEILRMEETGRGEYLFGFEESYGCLIGTYARDKDAVVATMALCEAAAFYKTQGKNLWDVMLEMYDRYGYYREDVMSVTMKGADGIRKIGQIMESLRADLPREIGGKRVLCVKDYLTDVKTDFLSGERTKTGLPKSNVLYFDFANGEWLCVRPSGTEPKIKLYIGVNGSSLEDAAARVKAFMPEAEKLLKDPDEVLEAAPLNPEKAKETAPADEEDSGEDYGPRDGFSALARIFVSPHKVVKERVKSTSLFFLFFVIFALGLVKLFSSLVTLIIYVARGYEIGIEAFIRVIPLTFLQIIAWGGSLAFLFWFLSRIIGRTKVKFRNCLNLAAVYLVPYVPYYLFNAFLLPFSGTAVEMISGALTVFVSVYFAVLSYLGLKSLLGKKRGTVIILALAGAFSIVIAKCISLL